MGIAVSLVLAAYVGIFLILIVIASFVAPTGKSKLITSTTILLTAILIPIWDIYPGELYFNHLCETESGVQILKEFDGQPVYVNDYFFSTFGQESRPITHGYDENPVSSFCHKNCRNKLKSFFTSKIGAQFFKNNVAVETHVGVNASRHEKYVRFWIEDDFYEHCVTSFDQPENYSRPNSEYAGKCVAYKFLSEKEAHNSLIKDPFPCETVGGGCMSSYKTLNLGIKQTEIHFNNSHHGTIAKVVSFEWNKGWLHRVSTSVGKSCEFSKGGTDNLTQYLLAKVLKSSYKELQPTAKSDGT
jgi:hypothetical protein